MFTRMNSILTMLFFLSAFFALNGCDELECAEGTVEKGGKCVAINYDPDVDPRQHCGPNTVWDGTKCVPVQEICGPYTEVEFFEDEDGYLTFICVGKPVEDIESPPDCPPSDGDICVNGWVRYLVDPDDPNIFASTIIADEEATEDATHLVVLVFDALGFATGTNTDPLSISEVNPRNGTFRATDIAVPATGFIGLVVEDCVVNDGVCVPLDPRTDPGVFAFTGLPIAASAGTNITNFMAYGATHEQVEIWTDEIGEDNLEAAGCPAGSTLLSCGTWIGVFAQQPASQFDDLDFIDGVVPYNSDNKIRDAYYMGIKDDMVVFNDPEPGVVWADGGGPYDYTGSVRGTVFFPGARLGTYYGRCSEDAPDSTCNQLSASWDEVRIGGSAEGALFIQFMYPE